MSADKSWPVTGSLVVGVLGLAVLLGGFGSWAALTSISGAVVAPGRIEVENDRQVVQHIDGGIVADILVEEGDAVDAGQLLIRLDPVELRSQLIITEGQMFELMARRGRLEAERDGLENVQFEPELQEMAATRPEIDDLVQGQRRLFTARRNTAEQEVDQLGKRASQTQQQIIGIQAQQASTRRQLGLIEQELENQQSLLDKGLAQASVLLSLKRTEANLEGRLGELIAAEAQANVQVTEVETEVLRLGIARREEAITRLRDLRYQELELVERRRNLIEQMARLDIKAPVSGVVHGLAVTTQRSVLRAADPVLYLVPQDRPLVIAAQVPPTDIDQLYPGQNVSLRLPALDQQQTPELFGTVALVSADAFEDQVSGLSFYRAEITLNPGELDRLPGGEVLIPGMPVESYIRTRDRSPLAYLIKPVADYFVKAFREA